MANVPVANGSSPSSRLCNEAGIGAIEKVGSPFIVTDRKHNRLSAEARRAERDSSRVFRVRETIGIPLASSPNWEL